MNLFLFLPLLPFPAGKSEKTFKNKIVHGKEIQS